MLLLTKKFNQDTLPPFLNPFPFSTSRCLSFHFPLFLFPLFPVFPFPSPLLPFSCLPLPLSLHFVSITTLPFPILLSLHPLSYSFCLLFIVPLPPFLSIYLLSPLPFPYPFISFPYPHIAFPFPFLSIRS